MAQDATTPAHPADDAPLSGDAPSAGDAPDVAAGPEPPARPRRGRGRHRRPATNTAGSALVRGATVTGAAVALPLTAAAGTAHAASDATWKRVASCESGGNWSTNTHNGFFGGLQFTPSTWAAYGGHAYAARPDGATRAQQVAVAEKVLAGQGPGAWPVCSRRAGLARGGPAPGSTGTVRVRPAAATSRSTGARTAATHSAAPTRSTRTAAARPAAAPLDLPTAHPASAAAAHHTVREGDTLSALADRHRVPGGWKQVYADNASVIGSDPNLILPGQRLRLVGGHTAPGGGARAASAPAKPSAPAPKRAGGSVGTAHAKHVDGAVRTGSAGTSASPKASPAPAHRAKAAPPQHPKPSTKPSADPTAKPTHKPTPSHKPAPKPKPKPAAHHTAKKSSGKAVKPVTGYFVSAHYSQSGRWSSGHHTGIDLAVTTGTPVHAALTGTVVRAGWDGAYGNEVLIRHADGRYSLYGHLSKIQVHVGQHVSTGGRIALSGATGNVTGPHLHFEVRTAPSYGSDINPVNWIARYGVHL